MQQRNASHMQWRHTWLNFNDIRNRDLRQQLCLESKGGFNETVRQTLGLEVMKWVVKSSITLWKMSDRTLWGSTPPPKQKKSQSRAEVQEMQEQRPLLEISPVPKRKEIDGDIPRPTSTLSWRCSVRREQLGSNHRDNQATGKEGETDHRCH
jgi:hypothetical protein